jgi:hypothetical protein
MLLVFVVYLPCTNTFFAAARRLFALRVTCQLNTRLRYPGAHFCSLFAPRRSVRVLLATWDVVSFAEIRAAIKAIGHSKPAFDSTQLDICI